MHQFWHIYPVRLDEPFKAKGVDGANPKPRRVYPEVRDALEDFVGRAMGGRRAEPG